MYKSIVVVGAGRAGTPIAARLGERFSVRVCTRQIECDNADLVVVCTPDSAISTVAASIAQGPWICHVSGATPLDALAPHTKRLAVHPLQTLQASGGPEQLDGAFAAVTAESDHSRALGFQLARDLGLVPFELADADRPLYHAGATVAASFLVSLHRLAADLLETADAPPAALVPLMQRVIENDFAPTGPQVRGDRITVQRHISAIAERRPELEAMYRTLSKATESMLTQ